MSNTRTCLACNEPLFGRSDKKFCSDQCRNSFNNQLNSDSINSIRNINRILKKNRLILKELNPKGKNKVHKNRLEMLGYKFNYMTHTYTTSKGTQYKFCYEYGYFELEDDMLFLVIDSNLQ